MLTIRSVVLALRLVDNKAILYFDVPSTTEALTWFRGMPFSNTLRSCCQNLTIPDRSHQPEHGTKSLIRLLVLFFSFTTCRFILTLAFHEIYGSGQSILLTLRSKPSNSLLYPHSPLQGNQSRQLRQAVSSTLLEPLLPSSNTMCLLSITPLSLSLSLLCLYISSSSQPATTTINLTDPVLLA